MPEKRRRVTTWVVALAVIVAAPVAVMAADAFDDVPDSNVHHDDIAWLKDAGVTLGCNPPDNTEFCPGDPVLRQQMASFMRRLAENQVVDAATAVTAESADSADSAESLNGITIDRFFHQAEANTTDEMIGTYGPITLYATCDGAGDPILRASWAETVNHLTFNGADGAQFGNATVDADEVINIGDGEFGGVGLAEAVAFDSNVHTSVEFFVRPANALGEASCFFSGFVTVG